MGVPIEKRLGNVQKALLTGILDGGKSFDPNNPEDVKKQKEIAKQVEAMQFISSLVTDPTGGGLVGVAKGISKAGFAKMAKAKFTQNRAKQIIDLVTKPMTRGKKAVPKATPTVKEILKTKPTIPTTIPSTMELAQIPGSSAKTIKEGIKSFTGKTENFVSKDPRLSLGRLKPFKDNKGLDTPDVLKFKTSGSGPASMEYKAIDPSKALSSKPMKDIVREDMLKALKVSAGIGAAGAGVIMGTDYLRGTFSPESVRKTNLSKTGPVDLKRINKNNLKDSSIPGVKKITAIVNGEEKEFGIVWDNKTQSWDYHKGGGKPIVKQTNPKQETITKEKSGLAIGGGDSGGGTKENNSSGTGSSGNQKTTTGSGTGTTPRSTTGQSFDKAFAEARKQAGGAAGIFEWNGKKYGTALRGETVPKDRVEVGKTTAPLMGDETYKADPSLEKFRQQDDDKQLLARAEAQKKEMEAKTTKPLSSLVFKTQTESKGNTTKELISMYDEERAMDAENRYNAAKNNMPKKKYGGNLAMLKYMKK